MSIIERHQRFWSLHQSGCFVIPNPWDQGSAKVMAALGATALATSSAAHAFTLGRPDMGGVSRDEALRHAEEILRATPLPVTGDFENGFGDAPDEVAKTVTLSGEIGLSGISVEDTMMAEGNAPYDFDLALDRIKAGVDAARALDRPFVFCARADGVMNGHYDVDEAMRRVEAFAQAGADLIYAPLIGGADEIRRLVEEGGAPVNVLAAGEAQNLGKETLAKLGVRRISTGSKIARVTHRLLVEVTRDVIAGDFSSFEGAASGDEIDELLIKGGQNG